MARNNIYFCSPGPPGHVYPALVTVNESFDSYRQSLCRVYREGKSVVSDNGTVHKEELNQKSNFVRVLRVLGEVAVPYRT